MTREKFEEKMQIYGFRNVFESEAETVWKRGKNQVELFFGDRILLSRGSSMVSNIPLKTLVTVHEIKNCVPETLVFSMRNGATVEIHLNH